MKRIKEDNVLYLVYWMLSYHDQPNEDIRELRLPFFFILYSPSGILACYLFSDDELLKIIIMEFIDVDTNNLGHALLESELKSILNNLDTEENLIPIRRMGIRNDILYAIAHTPLNDDMITEHRIVITGGNSIYHAVSVFDIQSETSLVELYQEYTNHLGYFLAKAKGH
jgi:hypothetical protein